MKKLSWVIVLLVIVGIVYVAVSPLITLHQIKAGIDERDSEQLSKHIDFPVLRQNMKEQFSAVMMKPAGSELADNSFGVLAAGFASKLVDTMVDSFVTPSGLAGLMVGHKPSTEVPLGTGAAQAENSEAFKNIRYSYDSISQFSVWIPSDSVWIPSDNGEETRVVIRRNGIAWKLTNIVVPFE